jgi:hypothetical protein
MTYVTQGESMKPLIIVLTMMIFSSFAVSGFFKSDEEQKEKDTQKEKARLCSIYTKKTEKYKETMRDDDFALHTYDNYKKRQDKYCLDSVETAKK